MSSQIEIEAASAFSQRCSRVESRRVRRFLNDKIFPDLFKTTDQLTIGKLFGSNYCQFNPLLDGYLEQETQKSMVRQGEWKCEICGKVAFSVLTCSYECK